MAKLPHCRVGILLHRDVSLSLALLMRDILLRTNQLLGRDCFEVRLVARPGLKTVTIGPVSILLSHPAGPIDYLIVPPLAPAKDPFAGHPGESRLIRTLHGKRTKIYSACFGSLLVAQSGLLAGRDATTHWNWISRAAQRFPDVKWDASRMICDGGDIVTAGGCLAAIDLTLALVERTCTRAASHEVGRLILADSVRQRQSVYATSLVFQRIEDPRMQRLEKWLQGRLSAAVTVSDMAEVCNLSFRSFHREFVRVYGVTPKKFVQLKRIEKVRHLLRDPKVGVEEAIASVGVTDVPSFRKVFRRELGLSPAEYRRRLRA
jgi:transcriptional regulator GlxA family with amidase domain